MNANARGEMALRWSRRGGALGLWIALAAGAFLAGCATMGGLGGTARMTDEWRAPDAPRQELRSLMVVSLDPGDRRAWEDEVGEEMRHEHVSTTASYQLFQDQAPGRDDVTQALGDGRAEAALVIRRLNPYESSGSVSQPYDYYDPWAGASPGGYLGEDRDRVVREQVTVWAPGPGLAGNGGRDRGWRRRGDPDRDAERARERDRGEWHGDRDGDRDDYRSSAGNDLHLIWAGTVEARSGRNEDRLREQVVHSVIPGLRRAGLL